MNTEFRILSVVGLALIFSLSACEFFTNNPGIEEVEVAKTDLAVKNITAPFSALLGEEITVHVELANSGLNDIADPIPVLILNTKNDSILNKVEIPNGLPADSSISLPFIIQTRQLGPGPQNISVKHEYKDQNPSNNTGNVNIIVSGGLQRDLAIVSMSAPSTLKAGEEAEITVTIANMGSEAVEDEIDIELLKSGHDDPIGLQRLDEPLNSNEVRTFNFNWNTNGEVSGSYKITARHSFEDEAPENNSGTLTVTIEDDEPVEGADLAIVSIKAPNIVEHGEEIEVVATIRNMGTEVIHNEIDFLLYNETYERIIDVIETDNVLETGETTDLTFTWNTGNEPGGNHTLIVSHNFEDVNPQNDLRSATVEIDAPLLTDLAITDFNGPSEAELGEQVELSLQIENTGQAVISSNEEIFIEIVNESNGEVIDSQELDSNLEIGESREFEFLWNTEEESAGEYQLMAVLHFQDKDASNNSQSLSINLFDPEPKFTVESFNPNEIGRNEQKTFTVTGTAFVEELKIEFFRKNDDDDDDKEEDAPKPVITQLDVIDDTRLQMNIYTWWFGPKKINWSVRFTHPAGSVVELNNVLKIRD